MGACCTPLGREASALPLCMVAEDTCHEDNPRETFPHGSRLVVTVSDGFLVAERLAVAPEASSGS